MLKLLAALFEALIGYFVQRQDAGAPAKAANAQAKAEAEAETTRDQADARVEAARKSTDEAIRTAQRDIADPDGVRRGAVDVQRAIDEANRGVR